MRQVARSTRICVRHDGFEVARSKQPEDPSQKSGISRQARVGRRLVSPDGRLASAVDPCCIQLVAKLA